MTKWCWTPGLTIYCAHVVFCRRVMCVKEIDFVGHFNKEWECLFENFYRPPAVKGSELMIYCKVPKNIQSVSAFRLEMLLGYGVHWTERLLLWKMSRKYWNVLLRLPSLNVKFLNEVYKLLNSSNFCWNLWIVPKSLTYCTIGLTKLGPRVPHISHLSLL